LNSFTTLADSSVQPSVGADITIATTNLGQLNNKWVGIGQILYVVGGGYYQVVSVPSLTTIEVKNLGYTGNAAPGATIASGGNVSPGGLQGVNGVPGLAGTSILFNDHTAQTVTTSATLYTYSMPQGTLAPNGSQLELEYWATSSVSVANRNLRIGIGGTTFSFQNLGVSSSVFLQRGSAIVTRLSATTVAIAVKSESYSVSGNIISTENYYTTSAAVTNLDSGGAIAVTLQSVISTTGNIVTEYFTIKRNLI
jgi:hypothetical protein